MKDTESKQETHTILNHSKKRLVFVALGTFILFCLLIVQYFKIQILEGERWTKEALAQHEFIVKEPCLRGKFYANTNLHCGLLRGRQEAQPLVYDVTKFHLYVDSLALPSEYRKEISQTLEHFLHIDEESIFKECEKKSRSRKVAMWLSKDTKEEIQKWWGPFARQRKIPRNALYFIQDYQRCYPFGKLLGQVLHTIRDVKNESTQEGVPTGGLEAYFNDVLKGKQGKRKLMRSPRNALEIDKMIEPPENGADIYLTINHTIQAIVEEELEKGVKASEAKGGWAVMMDPFTGDVLALAQYPFFEPAKYRDYFNDEEKIEDAKVKALTDAFELGSIMKPITVSVFLKANQELKHQGKAPLFSIHEKIDTTRTSFPGRKGKPLKDTSSHTCLNMYMAIQRSSNIYLAQIMEKVIQQLGSHWYRKTLIDTFGFGEKTGIELPSEAVGLIPTPGKFHPNGALEWSTSTPFSLAMGYNLLATSLQMVRAYAVFANGGYLVTPTLIHKIVKSSPYGEKILFEKEEKLFPKVLDEETIQEVITAMKFTTKTNGTAPLADIFGHTEAGKTGTSEKIVNGVYSKKRHISSFVGFTPCGLDPEHPPQFVLCVSLDEPVYKILEGGGKNHMGGRCTAPVFREISRRTLEFLGVEPDDPHGYPQGDPRFDPQKADWAKEVKELKILYDQWNNPK